MRTIVWQSSRSIQTSHPVFMGQSVHEAHPPYMKSRMRKPAVACAEEGLQGHYAHVDDRCTSFGSGDVPCTQCMLALLYYSQNSLE